MKKHKTLNIVLVVVVVVLLGILIGMMIYNKIDEKKRKYSLENLTEVYNNIKYNEKVNVYIFHGETCPHCKSELEYFDKNKSKYKADYNIYKFEVWNNENNLKLKKLVVDKLVKDGYLEDDEQLESYYNAVPFTIIGDQFVLGFDKSSIEEILNEKTYGNYDVMQGLEIK